MEMESGYEEDMDLWDPNNALMEPMSMNPRSIWTQEMGGNALLRNRECICKTWMQYDAVLFRIYHVPKSACYPHNPPAKKKKQQKTQHKRRGVAQKWRRPQNGPKQNHV